MITAGVHQKKTGLHMKSLAVCLFLMLIVAGCDDMKASDVRQPLKEGADMSRADGEYEVGTLRLQGGDWGYPSPFAHYPRGPGGFKMCLIFDSLLERDAKGLIPWLAQGYAVKDNGRSYEFIIRRGVKWQDGTPLTPEDVKFSIEYGDRHAMTWSYIFNQIKSVELFGEEGVRVTLEHPAAPMLYNIGRTRIIPKHIWENVDNPKAFTAPEAVIGSGPYRLDAYSKAHGTYRFTAFKDFWGPAQRVGVLEFVPVSQPLLAFENNEIDLTAVPPDLLSRFENDPSCRVVQSPAFWGYRLLFNINDGSLFASKKIRRAFRYAINTPELVEKIARGAAVPGNMGILPPSHVMYNPDVPKYHQDLTKAAMLFEKSGFTFPGKTGEDGKENADNGSGKIRVDESGSPLSFELLCSSQEVRMAELLRESLGKAGAALHIRSVDGKTRDARVRQKAFQLAIIGHGGWGADPDYLRTRFMADTTTGGSSPSDAALGGYENKALNALLLAQHIETDEQKRRALIYGIQEILAGDLPEIPLFYTAGHTVFRPGTYDGWTFMFDHHYVVHSKLSYLENARAQIPETETGGGNAGDS